MCLYKDRWLPRRAKEPIIVYKIFIKDKGDIFRTPFMKEWFYMGDTIKAAKYWFFGLFCKYIGGEGVHAYTTNPNDTYDGSILLMSLGSRAVVVQCEIPKGSYYWTNRRVHEIAATKTKMVKVIPSYEVYKK